MKIWLEDKQELFVNALVHKIYKKDNLRLAMINKYHTCMITNVNMVECDVAHIVPSSICAKYKLWYKYYKYNTLFLSKNLHITFDKYLWTFDIYSATIIDDLWVTMDVIINQVASDDISYSINSYIENTIKIPMKSIPFLYVNYQIFMYKNYQIKHCLSVPLTNKYYSTIFDDQIYDKLLNNPRYLFDIIEENRETEKIACVLNKQYDNSSKMVYLCLLKYHPFSSMEWKYLTNIDNIESSNDALDLYTKLYDSESDSSYIP
jgi:hypothetical protein